MVSVLATREVVVLVVAAPLLAEMARVEKERKTRVKSVCIFYALTLRTGCCDAVKDWFVEMEGLET